MKVVCMNSQNLIEGKIPLLTFGKIYDVLNVIPDESGSMYEIIDNVGNKNYYKSSRFVKLRDVNLNRLLL